MITQLLFFPCTARHKMAEQRAERSLTVRHVARLVGVLSIAVLSFDFCAHSHTWICGRTGKKQRIVSAQKLLVHYQLIIALLVPTKRILGT